MRNLNKLISEAMYHSIRNILNENAIINDDINQYFKQLSLTLEEKNDNLLRMQTFFNESIQKVCEHFSSNDIQTYLTEHQLTVMVNTNITLEDEELEFDDISTELYPILDELLKCDDGNLYNCKNCFTWDISEDDNTVYVSLELDLSIDDL